MNDIEEIKSRLDIVEVIRSYVPSLKKTGRSYKGLCPFHNEKTPSFIVTPDMQIFKCFGCGEGGDVISFIQKIERLSFPEALQAAADRAGYKLSQQGYLQDDDKLIKKKERIWEANKIVADFWHYVLLNHQAGEPGRQFMQKRKIESTEVSTFQLGYAPKGSFLSKFLLKKGISASEQLEFGFAVQWNNQIVDKFRDRFMLPIWDMKGNIVAFSGRLVMPNDKAPKYLNSPDTIAYKKSEILMGLFQAKEATRKSKFLILEEGNIDLLSSHKVGIRNIAATGGTALTLQQCKLIKRLTDSVYFCFDTDSAGIKALIRGVELAEEVGLKHHALDIGDYQDPDELIRNEPSKWAEVVASPVNTVTHLIKVFQRDLDMGTADGKSDFLDRLLPVLSSLRNEVQLQHFLGEVALLVGISNSALADMLAKGKPLLSEMKTKTVSTPQSAPKISPSNREIYLLALFINVKADARPEISGEVFRDINCKEIFVQVSKMKDLDQDFTKFLSMIGDGAKETLQQVLATDLSSVVDPAAELTRIYKVLYKNHIRTKILELRQNLTSHPDDAQLLQQLQYFTLELKQV